MTATNTNVDLKRIGLLKLVVGMTVGEQLKGKRLAKPEVVEFVRSFDRKDGNFEPPAHWEVPENGYPFAFAFCLDAKGQVYSPTRQAILGFSWMPVDQFGLWGRNNVIEKNDLFSPEGDVMNCMVVDHDAYIADPRSNCWPVEHRIMIELES